MQHVTKTIITEAISLTVILHRISLLLRVYYRITYTLFGLRNELKRLHTGVCISMYSYPSCLLLSFNALYGMLML